MLTNIEKDRCERFQKFFTCLREHPYLPTKQQMKEYLKLSPQEILGWIEETNQRIYYATPEEQEILKKQFGKGNYSGINSGI